MARIGGCIGNRSRLPPTLAVCRADPPKEHARAAVGSAALRPKLQSVMTEHVMTAAFRILWSITSCWKGWYRVQAGQAACGSAAMR